MAASQKLIVFGLGVFLVFSLINIVVTEANKEIHYDDMNRDNYNQCGPLHRDKCEPPPSNQYDRGCSKIERCGRLAKKKIKEARQITTRRSLMKNEP